MHDGHLARVKQFSAGERSHAGASGRELDVFAPSGENGAGKSTLVRMLFSLLAPDARQINVFGPPSDRHGEPIRRRVADVSADDSLLSPAASKLGASAAEKIQRWRI